MFNLGFSDVDSWLDGGYGFWGEYHRGDVPFLLAHMIQCSPTDSVDSDPLMKVVFVRFLHCQITSYSLIIASYSLPREWELSFTYSGGASACGHMLK